MNGHDDIPAADRPTVTALRRALKRAADGMSLDVTEAAVLLQARGPGLTTLTGTAARTRDAGLPAAGRPGVITYSRKVFLPITRLCRNHCHYCTFATTPARLGRAAEELFLAPAQVLDIARRGAGLGCKEALFTLGDRPEERRPEARAWLDTQGYDSTLLQDFRAKPGTAMRGTPHARLDELAATIAVARVVLGPSARIQAPPNLVGDEHAAMPRAGTDDWGGISPLTPDHVNPEHSWPGIGELACRTAGEGFTPRERLTVYPEFVRRGDPSIDPRVLPQVTASADPETGLAREDIVPQGLPWQSADVSLTLSGRTDLNRPVDTEGHSANRRGDFGHVYGNWDAVRESAAAVGAVERLPGDVRAALRQAAADPARLTNGQAMVLFGVDGRALEATGRQTRQRIALYGPMSAERIAAARISDGVLPGPDGATPRKLLPPFPTSPSALAAAAASASAPGCPSACQGGPAVARPE